MAQVKLRDRFQSYLRRIHPRFGRNHIDTLMTAGAAASSTFLSDISIWLTEGLGLKEGSDIMKLYLHMNDGPFQMHKVRNELIRGDNFTKVQNDIEFSPKEDETIDDEGSHDQIANCDTTYIVRFDRAGKYYKVPVLDGEPSEGYIHATVQIGDLLAWVKSKGAPLKWYSVHELRQHNLTILLESSMRKGEYKEIHLIQLYGAFVRRSNPWSPVNLSESEICFQLPKPSFKALQPSIEEIVRECEESESMYPPSSKVRPSDRAIDNGPLVTKNVWNKERDEKAKARLLVPQIDVTVATNKESWLMVGRMLRLLSKGGNDLLGLWTEWTRKHDAAIIKAHDKPHSAQYCKCT